MHVYNTCICIYMQVREQLEIRRVDPIKRDRVTERVSERDRYIYTHVYV